MIIIKVNEEDSRIGDFVRDDKDPKLSKYFLMKRIDSFPYLDYAKKCSSNRVYPLSIVEGLQDGEIIPDDENNIKAGNYSKKKSG